MSRRATPEERAAALADYAEGMSMKAVAKEHGLSESTVHGWIHRAGISRTNGAGKRLSAQRKRDLEFGLHEGHWTPNSRGIQVWQPCFFTSAQTCNINHQENRNAA